jgi:hypothetical protein
MAISPVNLPTVIRTRLTSTIALLLLVVLGLAACSDASLNVGEDRFFQGRILGVNVVAIDRMPELRYSVAGETEAPTHLQIVPSEDSMELVVIRLKVENHTATSTIFTVDKEGIQLRDFFSQRYLPIDVGERQEKVPNPPKRNSRSARVLALEPDGTFANTRGFIHGSVELKLHTGLDGWVIFEAPKDTKFRSFRWMAGDTVTIEF